jgi:hypothetical protein
LGIKRLRINELAVEVLGLRAEGLRMKTVGEWLKQHPGVRAKAIHDNVRGAPFKIGERVRVVGSKDETFDPRYKRRVGVVEYFEYQCGCGQSYPGDPMIGVRFRKDLDEFWREELTRHHAPARKRYSGGRASKAEKEG